MKKSCQYCGRIHPMGYECPKKGRTMKLTNYIWEIMDIGKANDADIGVARDMFIAN